MLTCATYSFRSGMHNSSGPKENLGAYPRARINIFVLIQRVFFSSKQAEWMKFWALRAKLKASTGHI